MRCVAGGFGNQLHRRRPGADDCDPTPGEVESVLPVGGVQHLPFERVETGKVGDVRLRQEPRGGDVVPTGTTRTVGGVHGPQPRLLIPLGLLDARAELHVTLEVVLVGDVLGIALEFCAGSKQPRPERIRLERVRVRHRRDVDGETGIVIDVPRATEVVFAFENRYRFDALPLEFDGSAHSTETCADDDDLMIWLHHDPTSLPEVSVTYEHSNPGHFGGKEWRLPVGGTSADG